MLDVILLVDRRSLDLKEESLRASMGEVIVVGFPRARAIVFVQQLDRFCRHLRERRLVGRALVFGARLSIWQPLPGDGAAIRPLHSSDMFPVLNRPSTREPLDRIEVRGVEHHVVPLQLRRLHDRLADVRTARDGLIEPLASSAEQHVHVMIDGLLCDRAGAAILFLRGDAVGHVGRPLASALVDVGVENGRRRIGQFRRADVSGLVAGPLRELENRGESRHRVPRAGDRRDAPVARFESSGPPRS